MPVPTKKPKGRASLTRAELAELKDRASYVFTALVATPSGTREVEVEAEATVARYFIATQDQQTKGKWCVTHELLGMRLSGGHTKKLARLLCAIWDKIPMDWATLTKDNALEKYNAMVTEYPEFKKWYDAVKK